MIHYTKNHSFRNWTTWIQ